jgi:predicted phage terminase large subunit-like protein
MVVKSKPLTITPEAALAERVRREKAKRGLIAFSEYVAPFYQAARHHRLVAEKLEQVELYIRTGGKEGIGRLMIFEPPRHGKSEQVSRLFPAWLLGNNPDKRVILTAYGADLAGVDSKAVRNYVISDRYRALFGDRSTQDAPIELSLDSSAANAWDLAEPYRGGVVASGIGGGITGKGAHLLVIDDPFKNRDEAESEAYRKKVMSWYKSSAYTRLEDGGAVVITHTRWHDDDLAGQLLKLMASDPLLADQWVVICLPSLALQAEEYCRDEEIFQKNLLRGLYLPPKDLLERAPGEALWPEKYSTAALAKIHYNIGPHETASLYQQQPRPAEGGFFDEKDFPIVERAPEGLHWVRYVDLALGETAAADWNTTLGTALDEASGIVYYRDMLRVHELTDFFVQMKLWMLSAPEKGVIWGLESVAFSSLAFKELMKDKDLVTIPIIKLTPEASKVSRARAVQTRAKQGLVRLVRGAWNQVFINEALAFPSGAHDDQIDTASGGLLMLSSSFVGSYFGFAG